MLMFVGGFVLVLAIKVLATWLSRNDTAVESTAFSWQGMRAEDAAAFEPRMATQSSSSRHYGAAIAQPRTLRA